MSPNDNSKDENESGNGPEMSATTSAPTGTLVSKGNYLVVAWDLDTTGRRLIDEICHIGGCYQPIKSQQEADAARAKLPKKEKKKEEKEPKEQKEQKEEGDDKEKKEEGGGAPVEPEEDEEPKPTNLFSQYVMPYKNPNPGARRSFGIRVVNIGRYRMLKDMETNKILKTKSEVSALQEFIDWLKVAAAAAECKDGVLLACHEPTRKVLVPLLLEAVNKYNLVADFTATVKGFVNTVHAVHKFGNMEKITSMSLRSLCKTVLDNTNPSTNNASDRSKVLIDILVKLTDQANNAKIDAGQVSAVAVTVDSEQADLTKLKEKLVIQGTLRPIFVSMLRKRRALKERAMALRSLVAESNVDYAKLNEVYESAKKTVNETVTKKVEQEAAGDAAEKTEEVEVEVVVEKVVVDLDKVKADLTEKVGKKVGEEDIAFLADLMESHFNLEKRSAAEAEAKEEARNNPRNFNNRRGGGGRGGRGGRGRGRGGGYRGGDRGNNKKPVPVSATEATPSESTC